MILASMISFLFGAALAQRLSVVALLPAMAMIVVLSVGAGSIYPQAAWEIVKMATLAAICLQSGYFAGIILRHFQTAALSQAPAAAAEASTHRTAH
jgi:hypothetical protein